MANNRFEIVGTIVKPKGDKENYRVVEGANGKTSLLNFSVKSNSNIINLNLIGFLAHDKRNRNIRAYKKSEVKGGKDEYITFLYEDKEKYLPLLSEYSKRTFVDGNDRTEFCHDKDFIDFIQEKLELGYFEGLKVRIKGNIEYSSYMNRNNEEVQAVKYIPTKIYVVENTVEDMAEANITMFIDDDSVIEGSAIGEMTLKGRVPYYSSKLKRKVLFDEFVEFKFEGDKAERALRTIEKRLNLDEKEADKFNEIGFKVDIIRGSESVKFTEDMLTEDERLNIELGLMTMEDIEKEKGGGKGEFKSYNKFKGLMRGYSAGAKLTDESESDYSIKMDFDADSIFGSTEVVKDEETIDLEEVEDDDVPF